jgi:ubiquinone biosynthesis protein
MRRSFRNIFRLLSIARTLARHDALFLFETLQINAGVMFAARVIAGRRKTEGRPGQRLARALHEAGPAFIKLGQSLATRSDVLGEEIATDLSELQDNLPPFSTAEARASIEAEFGEPVEALFSEFDDTSVAAASIAQVHFAITTDGREVAVKILRPGIEEAVAKDLDLLFWIAETIEATRPSLRRLRPVASMQALSETVRTEMDLRFEAAAASELRENFDGDPSLTVPDIDWARTGLRVLTTERLSGIPMDDLEGILAAGLDPSKVLTTATGVFFQQVFRDGFFHADSHPGNMFVLADGSIGVVDFGIMGRLDKHTKRYLGELLLRFLSRDYRRVAEIHFEAGWIPANQSRDSFTQACRSIGEPIMDKPQNEISIARFLGQLFKITETFDMETQPQLLLLQKTMLVAEGTGRKLNPSANMWFLARPLIEDWVRSALGPQAIAKDAASQAGQTLQRLPQLLENLEKGATALANGQISLHPDTIKALNNRKSNGLSAAWIFVALLAGILIATIAL